MFLANFIFVVSHLKMHLAVHLNTSKADINAVNSGTFSHIRDILQYSVMFRHIEG